MTPLGKEAGCELTDPYVEGEVRTGGQVEEPTGDGID